MVKLKSFACRSTWNREDSISKSGCRRSASLFFLYQVLDFIEILGVGASRVRDLFNKPKKNRLQIILLMKLML
jgi:hypothetical protein